MAYLDSFMNGLLLSAIACCLSSAIAVLGFRRTYHLSILLSAFAAIYLLAAWIIYTKKNPVLPHKRQATTGDSAESGDTGPVPELIEKSQQESRVGSFLKNPIPALLWSALQLAALIAILYSVFDIGAVYYG